MLMIRFQRIGRRNDPSFRMVVTEKTAGPKAGKFIDLVGTYNPKTKAMTVKADRIKHWIGNGAQVSPSLMNLLIKQDILTGKKVNVLPKKHPIKKEEEKSAEVAPTADTKTEPDTTNDAAPTKEAAEPTKETTKAEPAVPAQVVA